MALSFDQKRKVSPVKRTSLPISGRGGWSLSGASVVQRGKRFAVVAYAGLDPKTKKRRQKWFGGFSSKKEAETFRLTLAHHPSFSSGAGPYANPRLRTGDYLRAWLEERKSLRQIERKTAEVHEYLIEKHLAPRVGHIPLVRLAPQAVQSIYVSMGQEGLAPTTIRRAAAVLRAALQDAVNRGLLMRNPVDQTTRPNLLSREATVWTPEQIQTFLDDAKAASRPIAAFYTMIVGTGMRPGEILALRETDIGWEAGTVSVNRTLDHAGREPLFSAPKTKKARRTIKLPDAVLVELRHLRQWRRERKLALGPRWKETGLLFCGSRGGCLYPSNIRFKDFLPRVRRLGLPSAHIYDLRHDHATYLVADGVDYRTLSDRLGHSSPAFTISTYVHAAVKAQEHAAVAANKLLITNGARSR